MPILMLQTLGHGETLGDGHVFSQTVFGGRGGLNASYEFVEK